LSSVSGHGPIRCWEWLSCEKDGCGAHRAEDLRCWLTGDNRCFSNGISLTERLAERCFGCPVFTANRSRAVGKRYSDGALMDTLVALFVESTDLAGRVRDLGAQARGKACQVELLSEVGKALQSTMEIDRLLYVILTAVTAGNGLGFNRAFLMLVDQGENTVRGRMAVGPAEAGEADLIWKAMESEGESLGGILSKLSGQEDRRDRRITGIAERLILPLDGANKVARTLAEVRSFIVSEASADPEAHGIAQVLGSNHFIIVPLIAEGTKLGAIVADNFVTGHDITEADRKILETFASHLMARAAAADLEEGHSLRPRLEQIAEKALGVEQHLEAAGKSARKHTDRGEKVDIEWLIQDSLGLLGGLMMRLGVTSVVNCRAGDAVLNGNMIELRQLILNLLQNAVEAMPGGGTVTVETGTEGNMLRIDVRDTGPGIPPEVRPKIFSAFFTTKPEGLGLGLFSVKRIVHEYGGRIEMESEEGTGTCFTVLLPTGK